MEKIAFVTGCSGQDGSYCAEFLLEKDYKVIGLERRVVNRNRENLNNVLNHPNFIIELGDITDFSSMSRIISKYKPDLIFNYAAQSFVGSSWNESISTYNINTIGVLNILESIRLFSPQSKFIQASTSETMSGKIRSPQNEDTPVGPRSPYGASKAAAEQLVNVYKDSYNLFACFSRSFNHTSERRGLEFVERKITNYVGRLFNCAERYVFTKVLTKNVNSGISVDLAANHIINNGLFPKLKLGNVDTFRDFTHAKDIVRGMYIILQQETPDNYVLCSGETHKIRDILDTAFDHIGIRDWTNFVEFDPRFMRPAEVNYLQGDCTKAKTVLNWQPTMSFKDIIKSMVDNDIVLTEKEFLNA